MTSPLPLPEWVPWWVHLVILLVALLFALAFLLMPFSVFGVKARLEGVEARLDEIQGEIRSLALRMPLESGTAAARDTYVMPEGRARTAFPDAGPPETQRPEPRIVRPPGRTEPRLY